MKRMLWMCCVLSCAGTAGAVEVRNGSMTEGADVPTAWTETYLYRGKITVARDTNVYFTAPASLRVTATGTDASGQAQQFVEVQPGDKMRVEARVLAEGAKAVFGVQSYDAKWKGIGFTALGNAWTGSDWRRAAGEVEVPAGAVRIGLTCLIEGGGRAWFDDVKIVPAGAVAEDVSGAGATRPPSSATVEEVTPPPKAANAWSPAEGFWKDYPKAWLQTANGQIERAKRGGIDVVFIGDSLTQGWDKDLWAARYEPLKAVNFGIGGDGTPQVLWRIEHGLLDGYSAKAVVLMIGINNTWPGYPPEDTIKGIETCLTSIRAKQPKTRIVLFGVLPAFDAGNDVRAKVRAINAGIAKLADGGTVRFLDIGAQFLQPDGELKPELFKDDRLHLAAPGYKVWADALDPALAEALTP